MGISLSRFIPPHFRFFLFLILCGSERRMKTKPLASSLDGRRRAKKKVSFNNFSLQTFRSPLDVESFSCVHSPPLSPWCCYRRTVSCSLKPGDDRYVHNGSKRSQIKATRNYVKTAKWKSSKVVSSVTEWPESFVGVLSFFAEGSFLISSSHKSPTTASAETAEKSTFAFRRALSHNVVMNAGGAACLLCSANP